LRYCQAVVSSDHLGRIRTEFFCDWNGYLYQSVAECFLECSPFLISKSEASFIVILVFSLFVLGLVFGIIKTVVE
jgi:hypothetical protein